MTKIYHDHDLGPMNAYKSPTCKRCIDNRAATGIEIHTCEHAGAFGRRDTTCLRCRQLLEGVSVKTVLGEALARKKRDEAQRLQAIREHDLTACQKKNICCTHFEW